MTNLLSLCRGEGGAGGRACEFDGDLPCRLKHEILCTLFFLRTCLVALARSPKSSIYVYHEVLDHPLFSRHHRALFVVVVVVVVVVRRGVRPSSASGRINRIIIRRTAHVQEAGRHPRHRGRHRRRQGGRVGVRGRDRVLRER